MHHYELPIWPELYEQKSHLLKENQLLYAVLQVDKKEEPLKLSCRWFDDLTRADEAMVEACDQAYDRAKYQSNRPFTPKSGGQANGSNGTKANPPTKPSSQEPASAMSKLVITLNADQTRLSEILVLKECFSNHRGSTSVAIDFLAGEQLLATVQISASWGVTPSPNLFEAIKQLPSFVELSHS